MTDAPKLAAIKSAPSDLPAALRALADQVERGEVTEFVAAYTENGGYTFKYAASLHSCLVLAAMLYDNCLKRMRT